MAAVPGNPYANPGGRASADLAELLRRRIAAAGPVDFADFMGLALYHPEFGYYATGTGQVGRSGDFFTSVSVGEVFGDLLARRFLGWWRDSGEPAAWRIIECGAHAGTLARDVLASLRVLSPVAFGRLEYATVEPLPVLRAAQRDTLAEFGAQVRVLAEGGPLAARPLPGIVFGNEVIDALPCQVVEWRDGGWCRCRVENREDGGFQWVVGECPTEPDLVAALGRLGDEFADGCRTEVRSPAALAAFLEPLLAGLESGLAVWLDYGFARPEYYHPARREGTLRAFFRHRTDVDPLGTPGGVDLTAHVDFTALAEAALAVGARPLAFRDQGSWLTAVARPWLLAMEGKPDAGRLRQFQTLTHPGQLGARFHVLELAWRGASAPALPAADRHRLALGDGGG